MIIKYKQWRITLIISRFTCHMFHWNGNAHGPELLFFFDNESWRTETPQSRFTVTLKRWRNHNRSDEPEFTRPYPFSLLLVTAHNCDDGLLIFAIHFSLSFIYYISVCWLLEKEKKPCVVKNIWVHFQDGERQKEKQGSKIVEVN